MSYGSRLTIAIAVIGIVLSFQLHGQNGLVAEFYDGANFERYVTTQVTNKIDMSWYKTPPVPGIDPEVCSIRWTGKLKSPKTGEYRFSALVDDGIRVWVGDQLLIDDWELNDAGVFEGTAHMVEGQYYDLKVEYFNAMIEGEIRLQWELPVKKSWYERLLGKKNMEIIDAQYFYQPDIKVEPEIVNFVADNTNVPPSAPATQKTRIKNTKEKKVNATIPKKKVVAKDAILVEVKKEVTIPAMKAGDMTPEIIKMYTPANVQFERTQVEILETSHADLNILSEFLSKNSFLKVKIEGHTDVAGDPEKNLKLSERRAYAVARYLVEHGVQPKMIEAEGLGGTQPLVRSAGKIYHPENRRVSFIISIP